MSESKSSNISNTRKHKLKRQVDHLYKTFQDIIMLEEKIEQTV